MSEQREPRRRGTVHKVVMTYQKRLTDGTWKVYKRNVLRLNGQGAWVETPE